MSELKGNLLLVDDEELLLENTKILLEDIADNIFTASRGKEALKIIQENEIHAIICDIHMPEMSGVEVIQEVRKLNIETPFIFYTAHGDRELMKQAIKYGAFDFLNKPYMDDLEEITINALKYGLSQKGLAPAKEASEDQLITEYQKMLSEVKK